MERYPSIPTTINSTPIVAFDKLDGSNIRVEWSRKAGFYKFGSRTRLIDENEPILGEAVPLFLNKYADDLEQVYRAQRFEKTTAFLEFYGEHSFAGQHEDEPHTVTLFDVHVFKKGILPVNMFLKLFGELETPEVLYSGRATQPFIESVKQNQLEGITFEGVVCKGGLDNRNRLITFKVKTTDWLTAVKTKYGHDPALLNQII